MGWIQDHWHQVAGAASGTWLALAVWALLVLGVAALIFANQQIVDWKPKRLDHTSGCSWSRMPPIGM